MHVGYLSLRQQTNSKKYLHLECIIFYEYVNVLIVKVYKSCEL